MNNYAEVDLYDARLRLTGKFAYIQQLAEQIRNSATQDSGMCTNLLAQLHTACDESSCRDGNSQSFQLSVNQVCEAVNTRTVLNVKTAGEFFDFQVYTVNTDREEVEQTPIIERRAVSCCRKAQGENDKKWHTSPISQDSSCETLVQPWTSEDSAQYLLLPSPVITPLFPFKADRNDMFPQFFRLYPSEWRYFPQRYPEFEKYFSLPWSTTGPFNKYSSRDDSWKMEISTWPMPTFDFANFEYISVSRYNDFDMKVFIDDFAQASPTPSDWHDSGLKKLNGLKIQEINYDGSSNVHDNYYSQYFAILFDPDSGKLVKRIRKEFKGPIIEKESEISFARGWLRITRTDGVFTAYYSTLQEPSNDDDWNVVLPDSDMDTGYNWGYPSRAGIVMFAGEGDVLMAKALSVNGESVPPTLTGYTPYLQRGCGEGGGAMMSLQSCAAECDEKESCVAFNFSPDLDVGPWPGRCHGTSLIRVELPRDTPSKWTRRALGDSQCCESKGSPRKDGICFEWDGDFASTFRWFEITSEIDETHSYQINDIPSVKLKIYYQKESPEVVLSYNECGMWLESESWRIKTGGQRKEISIGLPYHCDETTGVCTRYRIQNLDVEGCVDVEIEEIDDDNCTSIEDSLGYKTSVRPSKMSVGGNSIVEVDSQYGCDCDEVSESLGCEPVNLHGNGACSKSGSGQIGLCRLSTNCDHYIRTELGIGDVWYFKDIVPPGYIKYEGNCTEDSQNLLAEITTAKSPQECTDDCGATYNCRSAAYSETDKKCLLFSSFICDRNKYDIVVSSQWSTYVRNEEEEMLSSSNTCPIVTYDKAEVRSIICL